MKCNNISTFLSNMCGKMPSADIKRLKQVKNLKDVKDLKRK